MIYFREDRRGLIMAGDAAEDIGNIPQYYDRHLGPLLFVDYAADISRRVAACRRRNASRTDHRDVSGLGRDLNRLSKADCDPKPLSLPFAAIPGLAK